MAKVMLRAGVGALALLMAAPAALADPLKAEVLHFWVSGGEAKAAKVIADAFTARGGQWVDNAVTGGDAARSAAISRIAGGNPPTAMMWNVGTAIKDLASKGMLNDVDAVAQKENWKAFLPPLVLDRMIVDGHVVAVPVNIHGENWLFANTKLLADLGIAMPKTWDEFFVAADKIKAAGFIPLAQGGEPWQELLLFRAIVAGQGGTDLYKRVFVDRDPAAVTSPEMKKALETLARLKTYTDPDTSGRSWNAATNMVITGQAAFQVMGDWAKGEFSAAGQTAGKEFACALPPGGGSGYIIAVDVFAFPKTADAAAIDAQGLLATTLMDPKVQTDFNKVKGSVPVRLDADPAAFDACGQLAIKTLADPANHLPNAALALSDDMEGAIEDLVTSYWNASAPDPDATLEELADIVQADR